jgi:hypothetical protein
LNYYCFVCWPDWKTWVAFEIHMLPLLAFVWGWIVNVRLRFIFFLASASFSFNICICEGTFRTYVDVCICLVLSVCVVMDQSVISLQIIGVSLCFSWHTGAKFCPPTGGFSSNLQNTTLNWGLGCQVASTCDFVSYNLLWDHPHSC